MKHITCIFFFFAKWRDNFYFCSMIKLIVLIAEADSDNGSSDEDDETSCSDDDEKSRFKNSARPKDESIEDKRQRKQAVRDAKAEKRKNKLPKHLKKRKEKQNTKKK